MYGSRARGHPMLGSDAEATTRAGLILPCHPPLPEAATQRAIIEPVLRKRLSEGDFWFTVVSEWLNQWKRHTGILPTRKHYHTRAPPGPILTIKDHGYNAELIPSEAWKTLVGWYGMAEGHKVIKQVVYKYTSRADIEHNFNSIHAYLSDGNSNPDQDQPGSEFQMRCSKLEKVGHVEWRTRQMFHIPEEAMTRLWGKTIESDTHWMPLCLRDKPIGKLLNIDSDFLRSSVALEVCGDDGSWDHRPSPCIQDRSPDVPVGKLSPLSIFDDPTCSWESDVHVQIDKLGQAFIEQLHTSFSSYVSHAKDFVDERDTDLRGVEQQLGQREERIRTRENILDQREAELNSRIEEHEQSAKEFEESCAERSQVLEVERQRHLEDVEHKRWSLAQERAKLEKDQEAFQVELQKMGELHEIQDSRIKLDIGGQLFTTSKLTLTKEPDSMLAAMFSGRHSLLAEPDGSYFIDRDGTHFRYILNYLRDGGIKEGALPQCDTLHMELLTEAQYYQLHGLVSHLKGALRRSNRPSEERL